jgi:hypothetical protein
MPHPARSSRLIFAAACLFAVLLLATVFLARDRERRAAEAARKQATFTMLELTGDVDAANAAMTAFNLDGALDFKGLEAKPALDRRIDLAARAQASVERVLQRGDAAKDKIAGRVDWPRNRRVYETHRDAYAAARAQLEFLRNHAGHWKVEGQTVDWDSQQLQSDAEKLARRVDAALRTQGSLVHP